MQCDGVGAINIIMRPVHGLFDDPEEPLPGGMAGKLEGENCFKNFYFICLTRRVDGIKSASAQGATANLPQSQAYGGCSSVG